MNEFSKNSKKQTETYDVIIVGGGINGTGVARDAALRGLRVCLVEKGDLGGATSSHSTKLIHGGLRYLEFGAFKLVREALLERRLLMKMLPGFIREMRFVLPYKKSARPYWLIRFGLWIYDHLGPLGSLQKSSLILKQDNPYRSVLHEGLDSGFEYSDCTVDDARLVILNALEAHAAGAVIYSYQKVISAQRRVSFEMEDGSPRDDPEDSWQVVLEDGRMLRAKALVNATGPYVNQFIENEMKEFPLYPLRLVRGSHIVVPRIYDHDRAFLLQQTDGRVVFTLPYERHFTLIGTTEAPHENSLEDVAASEAEIDYLINAVGQVFKKAIKRTDIAWSFAGVRPLFDEGKKESFKASRDYSLAVDVAGEGHAALPVVHIYGGKITTFRKLACEVVDRIKTAFPDVGPSRTEIVPYAAFDDNGHAEWLKDFHERFVLLPLTMRKRWLAAYGRRAEWFLKGVRSKRDLGQDFGAGFFELELRYLISHEWAVTAEDVLWRRTKLGLHLSARQQSLVTAWMAERDAGQLQQTDSADGG